VIFVTVGTQLPFDRLVRAIDQWAKEHRDQNICAQVAASGLTPQHIATHAFLSPSDHRRLFSAAELIVSHAGIGSIAMALELQKPIIVMPRRADLHEHRNDHQQGTAMRFASMGYVNAAYSEVELWTLLDQYQAGHLPSHRYVDAAAESDIVVAVRHFLSETEIAMQAKLPSLKRTVESAP